MRTRRRFIQGVAGAGAAACVQGGAAFRNAELDPTRSQVFRVHDCPIHDGQLRHVGVDTLLGLLADNGVMFYQTAATHPWGGPGGIVASDDVVLIKVNCQWKCRGTTNTDVVRGLIHRILDHPDGFTGEVVIFENGQSQGAFDGFPLAWGSYDGYPAIRDNIVINAEEQGVLTVDYLVNTVFAGQPVSSYLLDPVYEVFIGDSDHTTDGYRMADPPPGSTPPTAVSYPCFTTAGGNRIELRDGRWTGSAYADNVKLINVPVLKDHDGTGITGVLKHSYGILSMSDSSGSERHYTEAGSQCGKMWSVVRVPDLNILDCIWVTHEDWSGYPPDSTHRVNQLLAGLDPVALDYYGAKHVLLPLGGWAADQHDPDTHAGLMSHLGDAQAFINANGGIGGVPTRQGDTNIEVLSRAAAGGVSPGASSHWSLF